MEISALFCLFLISATAGRPQNTPDFQYGAPVVFVPAPIPAVQYGPPPPLVLPVSSGQRLEPASGPPPQPAQPQSFGLRLESNFAPAESYGPPVVSFSAIQAPLPIPAPQQLQQYPAPGPPFAEYGPPPVTLAVLAAPGVPLVPPEPLTTPLQSPQFGASQSSEGQNGAAPQQLPAPGTPFAEYGPPPVTLAALAAPGVPLVPPEPLTTPLQSPQFGASQSSEGQNGAAPQQLPAPGTPFAEYGPPPVTLAALAAPGVPLVPPEPLTTPLQSPQFGASQSSEGQNGAAPQQLPAPGTPFAEYGPPPVTLAAPGVPLVPPNL